LAESRDAVQRLDGEGVVGVWAESPHRHAAPGQASLRRAVQHAIATRRAEGSQSLEGEESGEESGEDWDWAPWF